MMDRSQRCAARIFGITYLLGLAIVMIAFSRYYAPYLVWESGEETARHFLAHESAIRIYLAGTCLYGIAMIVALTALYVLLRPVNRGVALFATFSKLIYAVFWYMTQMGVFGALRMVANETALRVFGPDGQIALAGSQLAWGRDAYYIGLVFTGLGSALFAWVFFQSRYIPRTLALLGVPACLFEAFCGFAYLIQPRFGAVLSPDWYELPAMVFELILSVWLLVKSFRSAEPIRANTPLAISNQ